MNPSKSKIPFAARALLCAALAAATAADAQYQGRQRGGQARSGDSRETRTPQAAAVSDPVAAIERELPSLRADLRLSAEQAPLWSAFERRVRDAGETSRAQMKYLSALRIDKEKDKDKPSNALAVLNALADIDARRSDAMRDATARLKALEEKLTPEQNTLLDKRLPLSLTDPLGSS